MIQYQHFLQRATFDAQIKTKSGLTDLAAAAASTTNGSYYAIVFIKDTQEIYTHGQFYDCSEYDDTAINNLITDLTGRVEVLEATAEEFDALVEEVAENELVTAKALSDLNNNKVERTELPDFETFASVEAIQALEAAMTSINADNITSGTISLERLPQGALERLFVTASESTAMSLDIQNGDVVKVTGNNNKMYFCSNDTATTFVTKFTEFTAGTATSVAWSGVTGKPDLATQAELDVVDAKFSNYIPKTGGIATGNITVPQLTFGSGNTETDVPMIAGSWAADATLVAPRGIRYDNCIAPTNIPWASNYANAVLTLARLGGTTYSTQLGFGPEGMYYRHFNDANPTSAATWSKFVLSDLNNNVAIAGNLNVSGTTTTDLLNVGSDASVTGCVYAMGYYESSDERLKTFNEPVNVDLDALSTLRKSHFTYNANEQKKEHIGVSAQEIQKLYPEVVNENEDGYLSVDYAKLSVIALKAVDELYARLLKLEAKINA